MLLRSFLSSLTSSTGDHPQATQISSEDAHSPELPRAIESWFALALPLLPDQLVCFLPESARDPIRMDSGTAQPSNSESVNFKLLMINMNNPLCCALIANC